MKQIKLSDLIRAIPDEVEGIKEFQLTDLALKLMQTHDYFRISTSCDPHNLTIHLNNGIEFVWIWLFDIYDAVVYYHSLDNEIVKVDNIYKILDNTKITLTQDGLRIIYEG